MLTIVKPTTTVQNATTTDVLARRVAGAPVSAEEVATLRQEESKEAASSKVAAQIHEEADADARRVAGVGPAPKYSDDADGTARRIAGITPVGSR